MRVKNRGKRGRDERRILIGMVVDATVLSRVAPIVESDRKAFRSKWANLVAGWCVKYYNRYGEPPRRSLETLFLSWSEKTKDEATVAIVEKFLNALTQEYEQDQKQNVDYVMDLAGEYFNAVRLGRLQEDMEAALSTKDVGHALEQVNSFRKIEVGRGAAVDVFQDQDVLRHAFSQDQVDVLISYGKQLDSFFGPAFSRDSFIGFMGPEKRGKSFWLMDLAYRSAVQCNRTAFFVVGDMSQSQVMRRIAVRQACRPIQPQSIYVPTAIRRKKGKTSLKRVEKSWDTSLNWTAVAKSFAKTIQTKVKSHDTMLKLSCHPADSVTAMDIDSTIKGWEREGWVPDVVVIDYADILAAGSKNKDSRDQINETWLRLRSISQEYHCLVVTATQSDAQSYEVDLISRKHFSNDKRKAAHVTGMIGLNQTDDEATRGIMRLNWPVPLREAPRCSRTCVYVAECRSIANPACGATWGGS